MKKDRRTIGANIRQENQDKSSNIHSVIDVEHLSVKKRKIFKLLLFLLPFLGVLLLEVGLRLAKFGYAPSFLIEVVQNGEKYYAENQYFGYRFFPAQIARRPEPFICIAKKPANTCRILVLGESAALGDPAPAYGFSRMLETILNERIEGLNFEVINVSMTAINSHVLTEIASDCRKLNADFWLLYIGNNEVIGPFGPATVFTFKNLPYPIIRMIVKARCLRTVQFLQNAIDKFALGKFTFKEWGGMEMFINNQVRFRDKSLESVYNNFKKNISFIIKIGRECGADVLVSTTVANYRDCAPFGCLHRIGLLQNEVGQWNEYFEEGKRRESAGDFKEAIGYYKKAESIDDTYAELHFRLAKCVEKVATNESDLKIAEDYYRRAVDCDTMRFRPDSRILDIIRNTASNFIHAPIVPDYGSVAFVDPLENLRTKYGIKIPGNDVLWEHVHLNFRGNYLLASIYADEIENNLKSKLNAGKLNFKIRTNSIDESDLYSKICLTDYDRLKIYMEMEKRLSLPPFTYRANQSNELARLKSEIQVLEKITGNDGVGKYISDYERLVEKRPMDYILRQRYAELLDENGMYDKALEQWEFIKSMLPHYPSVYLQIGNLLDKMGRSSEAIPYFETALKKNPQSAEVYSSLGLCLLNLHRHDEAIVAFKNALKLKPDFAAIYVNMSLAYSEKGDMESAKQQCFNALRVATNYGAAYLNLGKYYALEGNHELALSNYLKVVAIENKNAIGFYNVANALSRLGRKEEALTNYLKAVELNPNFGEAHLNLAFDMLDLKDNQSALKHFQIAAQLMTNNVIAQINCGIAFARAGRFSEAAVYLERALKLDPSDPQIHYNLGLLYLKMGQRDKAVIEFSKTLELKPDHREAGAQLDRIMPKQ